MNVELDDEERMLILNAMRGAHVQTMDALAACGGGAYGERPATEPNVQGMVNNRRRADVIELLVSKLGGIPFSQYRRREVEKYLDNVVANWEAAHSVLRDTREDFLTLARLAKKYSIGAFEIPGLTEKEAEDFLVALREARDA